jgi:hypothetical protein
MELHEKRKDRRQWLGTAAWTTWFVATVVVGLAIGLENSQWWWLLVPGFLAVLVYLGYKWLFVWFEERDWFVYPDFQTLDINRRDEDIYDKIAYKDEGEN